MNNNKTLIQSGLDLRTQQRRADGQNSTAVLQHLTKNRYLQTALIATPHDPQTTINRIDLLRKIKQSFNLSELRTLCFALRVDHEQFSHTIKSDFARELILYMERLDRLPELLKTAASTRPKANWQVEPDSGTQLKPKLDLAVIIDMTKRSIANGVAQYLDDTDIDANFLYLQLHSGEFLQPEDDWSAVLQGFSEAMTAVKETHTGARIHFFLSAPGALLFGMGNIWGTVDEGVVYHYQDNTYHPTFRTSRELR